MGFDLLGLGFLYWEWDSKTLRGNGNFVLTHWVKKIFFRIRLKQKSNNSVMEFYLIKKKVNHDDKIVHRLFQVSCRLFVIVTSPLGAQCTSAIKWSAALLYRPKWQPRSTRNEFPIRADFGNSRKQPIWRLKRGENWQPKEPFYLQRSMI